MIFFLYLVGVRVDLPRLILLSMLGETVNDFFIRVIEFHQG
ncbi:MAG: hypothetical protein ACPHRC_06200 [Candidatus Puniceispirillales bacterium]